MKKLYPYQEEGVKWIRGGNGILCDEPGLGKTVQALLGMDHHRKIIVVCPKSVIPTWVREVKKWTPDREIYVLWKNIEGWINTKNKAIWIINYEQVKKIPEKYWDTYITKEWNFPVLKGVTGLIWDELHRLRNHVTLRHIQCGMLAGMIGATNRKRPHIIGLTGTPLTNRPEELVQLKIYVDNFKKPRVLRREKSEVADQLPPVIVEEQYVELNRVQKKCYKEVLEKKLPTFSKITELKKVSISANLYDEKLMVKSEKFERAFEIIQEEVENGNKVLVFSQWIKPLRLFENRYLFGKIGYAEITGDTKMKVRERIMREFREEKYPQVLLMTLKTGGEGLNLDIANTVIFLDLWWTYTSFYQALNRIHRLTQRKPVRVVKLIAADTIEERIDNTIKEKKEITEAILTLLLEKEVKYL